MSGKTQAGSEARDELFEIPDDVLESTMSRRQRLYRSVDEWVLAPIRVGMADWRMPLGAAIVVFFILLGLVGPAIVPAPMILEASPFLKPFPGGLGAITQPGGWIDIAPTALFGTGITVPWFEFQYPLGTDRLGQGVGKALVYGTPAILQMAAAGALFSTAVAVMVGTVSGYKGGRIDTVLMAATDIVLTIPALPLVILLTAIYQPQSPFVLGIILAIDNWPGLARALRSQVLTIRQENYVEAARTMDISSMTILRRDVVAQLMPYTLINAATSARNVIFESVALFFLGLLPSTGMFNWGVMMNQAYQAGALSNIQRAGHWLFAPMIVLTLFSFGLIILSQGLDRVFNPQLRAKHAKSVGEEESTDITS